MLVSVEPEVRLTVPSVPVFGLLVAITEAPSVIVPLAEFIVIVLPVMFAAGPVVISVLVPLPTGGSVLCRPILPAIGPETEIPPLATMFKVPCVDTI